MVGEGVWWVRVYGRQGYVVGQGSERERTRGWVTSVVGKRPGMVLTRQVL